MEKFSKKQYIKNFNEFCSVAESIHYELNHNSFQMSCELTHFTSNSEFEFKELLRENDGINVNSAQK